jgi:hypothetical protein
LRRFDPRVEAYIDELTDLARKSGVGANEASSRLRTLIETLKLTGDEGKILEADFKLYLARRRMLIGGNILLTMIVGVAGLAGWLVMAAPYMATWGTPHYFAWTWAFFIGYFAWAWGFVIGVCLHVR